MLTVQVFAPSQAPLQPANCQPVLGVAVSVTSVSLSNDALQVPPQSMPAGELVTDPEPRFPTVSA
jgi:hypothetical protein